MVAWCNAYPDLIIMHALCRALIESINGHSSTEVKGAVSVGIIGDYNPQYKLHDATTNSLHHAAKALSIPINVKWIPTGSLDESAKDKLSVFDSLWCAPGSPYQSFEGALRGIEFARKNDLPFLGTCGGFQHAIIEYARNVLGVSDADHEENNPDASTLFVTRLTCSPFGRTMIANLDPQSLAYRSYQRAIINETYHCNFGLNPAYKEALQKGGLRITGTDEQGEVRVLEITGNKFFIVTLFVPQLSSTLEKPHPLIASYLQAASEFKKSRFGQEAHTMP